MQGFGESSPKVGVILAGGRVKTLKNRPQIGPKVTRKLSASDKMKPKTRLQTQLDAETRALKGANKALSSFFSGLDHDNARKADHAAKKRVPKSQRPQCGARCRDGHACLARVCIRPGGELGKRCKRHGGASTGPSLEGRKRIAEANRERAAARRNGPIEKVR